MEKKEKFKKDEDVFYISKPTPELHKGKGRVLGRLKSRHGLSALYLVEFYEKKYIALHNGLSTEIRGPADSCWWCREDELLNKEDYFDYELSGEE